MRGSRSPAVSRQPLAANRRPPFGRLPPVTAITARGLSWSVMLLLMMPVWYLVSLTLLSRA
eukprot:3627444-Lingulodinium_polyedra.AAC.1